MHTGRPSWPCRYRESDKVLSMWIQIALFVVLISLGFTIGGFVERAHFRRLAIREAMVNDLVVTNLKVLPSGCSDQPIGLVSGQVVIASDYFKTFLANLRKMVGGELRTYESLMERARREAVVRMLESAKRLGASHVINVRFASSNIGSGGSSNRKRRGGGAAMVEMYAYGTAVFVPSVEMS